MTIDLSDALEWVRSHHFGKYRGVVKDNDDPQNLGRLQVEVSSLKGYLAWALPCVPYAGDGVGLYAMPEPGTNVWVEFERGDISYPVWTGCFWGDGELPDSAAPAVKIWKSKECTVKLDDDATELLLENSSDSKVTISDSVKIESGEATHTVGSEGVVSEQGAGKVEVTSASVSVNNGALELMG